MARASFKVTQWNADKILARSTQILEEFAPLIAEEARSQIKAPIWNWPGPTLRRKGLYSGRFVPKGDRDIVDTGNLLNSQTQPEVARKGGLTSLSIRWSAPYSLAVQTESYVTSSGAVAKPRNWIVEALRQKPVRPFFFQRWRELSGA